MSIGWLWGECMEMMDQEKFLLNTDLSMSMNIPLLEEYELMRHLQWKNKKHNTNFDMKDLASGELPSPIASIVTQMTRNQRPKGKEKSSCKKRSRGVVKKPIGLLNMDDESLRQQVGVPKRNIFVITSVSFQVSLGQFKQDLVLSLLDQEAVPFNGGGGLSVPTNRHVDLAPFVYDYKQDEEFEARAMLNVAKNQVKRRKFGFASLAKEFRSLIQPSESGPERD